MTSAWPQIESRHGVDPLTEEKMARMDTALDEAKSSSSTGLTLDRSRPALGQPQDELRRSAEIGEHKAAFASYIRSGEAGGLKRLEGKALSAGSGPDGGYLAPSTRRDARSCGGCRPPSPIRSPGERCRTISSGTYKKAYLDDRAGLGLGRRDRGAAADRLARTLAEL